MWRLERIASRMTTIFKIVTSIPKLKSLKIGRYSFSRYTVCEIENVDALETIEMGNENQWSYAFSRASLELKSILIHNE